MVSINQVEDRAEARVSFGNRTSLALLDALKTAGLHDEILLGLFHRIRCCASRSNHWIGDDLHNRESGELYAGNGSFWACHSKLCPSCIAKAAGRNRKKLKLALGRQRLHAGESYKFITLTIPNPHLSLFQTRAILDKAWSLFRKRKYFKDNIRGCAKGEEFTYSETGYHFHFHLLCLAKFLSFEHFRYEWTDCVKTAFYQFHVPFKVNNKDNLLDVYIKQISSSKNDFKEAIQKICSYLTKSNSWEKIPEIDLIEVASIERFPRVFSLLGSFRNLTNANNRNGSADIILNKQDVNDGEIPSNKPPRIKLKKGQRKDSWRKYIEKFGLQSYQKRLAGEVDFAEEYRKEVLSYKFPYASFKTLDEEDF